MRGKNIQEIYEGWKNHRRWLRDQRLNSGTNARIFARDLMEEITEAQAKKEVIPDCLRFMDEDRIVREVGFLTYDKWPHSRFGQYCPNCGCGLPTPWAGRNCPVCRFTPKTPKILGLNA